ncbi:hypothetical protein ACLKA6_012375 [Drosophila palustris]
MLQYLCSGSIHNSQSNFESYLELGNKTNRIEIANSAHEFSAYTVYFWPKLGQQAAQVDNDVDNDRNDDDDDDSA